MRFKNSVMTLNKHIYLAVFILFSFTCSTPTVAVAELYIIELKNGNIIKSPTYSEKDGKIYFERFGSTVGISKDRVAKISASKKQKKANASSSYRGFTPPVYLQVSGVKNTNCNGVYEERGKYNGVPTYKQINNRYSIFYYSARNPLSSAWAIGEYSHNHSHFSLINPHITQTDLPEKGGIWTSTDTEIMYPEIKVSRISPPKTIYKGNHRFIVEGFPVSGFNGVYSPESIFNGYIKYSHEKKPYKLYKYAGRWVLARCEVNCFEQYQTQNLLGEVMPEYIENWYDLNRESVNGSIKVYKP